MESIQIKEGDVVVLRSDAHAHNKMTVGYMKEECAGCYFIKDNDVAYRDVPIIALRIVTPGV